MLLTISTAKERLAALTLFFSVFLPVQLAAQESRATITGTVSDQQNAPVPGAAVVAKNNATNLEAKTTTNEAGLYVVPLLNIGTYTLTVMATGFKSSVRSAIDLSISERRQIDFQLE